MSTPRTVKQQARALALAESVSYTEALRRVTTRAANDGTRALRDGEPVTYRPHPGAPAEGGHVVRLSKDGTRAFVLYEGDTTPKATRVSDLTPAHPD